MPMSPDYVRDRVAELRALVGRDDEAAAAGAEQLRCQVLREIADGNPEAAALARQVIETIDEDIGGD